MPGDAFDHLGHFQVAFVVDGVNLDAWALLALLVLDLAAIRVDLVDRQAWAGFQVAAVLNLNRPLIARGEFQILKGSRTVCGIGFTHQAQEFNRVLDAWVFGLVLVI